MLRMASLRQNGDKHFISGLKIDLQLYMGFISISTGYPAHRAPTSAFVVIVAARNK